MYVSYNLKYIPHSYIHELHDAQRCQKNRISSTSVGGWLAPSYTLTIELTSATPRVPVLCWSYLERQQHNPT